MPIASRLKERLDFVQNTVDTLILAMEDEADHSFVSLKAKINAWSAKIAVIGQVKAGKSTLLNAVLEQHDFLPSDINPWTSVVTNLRINLPDDPETGVSFEFFSEEDWNGIIEGKSAIGDLSEDLLPGFDSELLREQSKELREQARERLGNHYQTMLGKTHEFNFTSADLLKRYVCAGADSVQDLKQESSGRYAALTREANVYQRFDAYQVPTILTDTPGINDPFLVRDEVTCRALDRSDMFIMVLSAHQALTDIDLGLMRLLSQQGSRDVLIFVNRLDEVDQYDSRYEKILKDVSDRLDDAIPDNDFKIILGSGFMADAVQTPGVTGAELREELDTPVLAAYLEAAYGRCPYDQGERLMLGSGVTALRDAMSEMIENGVAKQQVEQLLEDTRTQIVATKFSYENAAKSVSENIDLLGKVTSQDLIVTIGDELLTLEKAAKQIDDLRQTAQDKFEATAEASRNDLDGILSAAVDDFLKDQAAMIENSLMLDEDQVVSSEALTIYLGSLHRQIETAVSEHFEGARADIDAQLLALSEGSCELATKALREKIQDVSLENLPYEKFSTTLTMAKQSIDANLVGKRSLAFWKQKSIDVTRTVKLVTTLAKAEMVPAIRSVLDAYVDAHRARFAAGLERISLARAVTEQAYKKRGRFLKEHMEIRNEFGTDAAGRSEAMRQLKYEVDELKYFLGKLTEIEKTLDEVPTHMAA